MQQSSDVKLLKSKKGHDWAGSAAKVGGFATIYGLSAGPLVATAAVAASIGSMLAGLPITIVPWVGISMGVERLFLFYPKTKWCAQFLLHASMAILTGFIGLAIVGSFVALGANPFTLPALIAVAISAAIVFGLAVAVGNNTTKSRDKTHPTKNSDLKRFNLKFTVESIPEKLTPLDMIKSCAFGMGPRQMA